MDVKIVVLHALSQHQTSEFQFGSRMHVRFLMCACPRPRARLSECVDRVDGVHDDTCRTLWTMYDKSISVKSQM